MNSVKVVFTKEGRTSLVKTFLDRKLTLEHNRRANLWNQTHSIVFTGKKTLNHEQHYIFQKPRLHFMIFRERVWGGKENPKWSLGLLAIA
jgi:hypothetical protein